MTQDIKGTGYAFDASRVDRDRTLEAMRTLEAALGRAAGGARWTSEVCTALASLEVAMADERGELHRPDALLALIAAENPRRFGPRIRNLRDQYDDIIRQLGSLRRELGGEAPDNGATDAGDVRQRAGWILRALQHYRHRQTDLVYEALLRDLEDA